MSSAPAESETARLERELDILRERYATLDRGGRMLKVFFTLAVPVGIIVLTALVVYAFLTDIVVALFVLGMAAFIAGLLWIGRDDRGNGTRSRKYRWIDFVSPECFSTERFVKGLAQTNPKSEQAVEEMIALREKHLAELKRGSS